MPPNVANLSLRAVLTVVATWGSDIEASFDIAGDDMRRFNSFSEIIDAFGVAVVAEIIRKDESHVRTMKARNSIPPEYWGLIVEEAPKRQIGDLAYSDLVEIRSERFATPERAA